MNTRLIASLVGSCLLALCSASSASAQAQHTFVSASGSDKDTCTRADPCRNFNRALSLTAAGGEVVALDSATYESFAINKSVSVSAAPRAHAAISAALGDGIRVGAGPSDVVVLRGLDVESLGGGFAGILQAGLFATNGARVSIHNSVIAGNSQQGIVASGNGPGSFVEVDIEGCMIASNGTEGVDSDANGTAIVRISNSIVTDNSTGLHQAGTALLLSRGNNTVEGNKMADTQGTVGSYAAR